MKCENIEEKQNEAFDLGYQTCLRDNAKMPWNEAEELQAYRSIGSLDHLSELAQAEQNGRLVVLPEPRKPLVWGDDDHNQILCPYCGNDLMGIPYGERLLLQCPECGQYLNATKVIAHQQVNTGLGGEERC